jgi:uncharacterized membrane protein YkvA (DUF1232 family)
MNKAVLKKLLPYAIVLIGVIYGVWPIDAIPDIPIVGWLDDAGVMGTVLIIALKMLSKKSSKDKETT